jgi:hypothetical protein
MRGMVKRRTLAEDLHDGGFGNNIYVHGKAKNRFAYKVHEIRKDYDPDSNASAIVFQKYNSKSGKRIEAIDVDGFDRLYLNACLNDKRAKDELIEKILGRDS